jgi:two-component system, LuxR family, response regulator DctR
MSTVRDAPLVYLVDDEAVLRDALAWLLRSKRLLSEAYADAIAFDAMVAQAMARGPWPISPSCVVLDVRMPGMSGLTLFDKLADQNLASLLPVIFLTGHGDVPTAVAALKRGAFDFVEKPFTDNTLVERVERALAASAAAIAERDARFATERAMAELTERERDVMKLVVQGLPNKLIADALDISVRTVEVHRARVFDKMKVKSAVELANLLRQPPAAG